MKRALSCWLIAAWLIVPTASAAPLTDDSESHLFVSEAQVVRTLHRQLRFLPNLVWSRTCNDNFHRFYTVETWYDGVAFPDQWSGMTLFAAIVRMGIVSTFKEKNVTRLKFEDAVLAELKDGRLRVDQSAVLHVGDD